MTNLNESEKKIILFLNSGYAKWFKTNKKNLVFENNNKQTKVTPNGRII